MEAEVMNTLSILIKKERITNNILFMLKSRVPELEKTALEHGKYLYALIKLFSNTGFNIELEEPKSMDFTRDQVITMFLNDITTYSEMIKKNDPKLIGLLSELLKIKISILNYLIFITDRI
jgi:hypothetical protein